MPASLHLMRLLVRALHGRSATRLTRTVQHLAVGSTAAGLSLLLLGSAIVNGFQWEIPQRMGQFWGHLQVQSLKSEADPLRRPVRTHPDTLAQWAATEGIRRIGTVVLLPGLCRSSSGMEGALLKGCAQPGDLEFFEAHLTEGRSPRWKNPATANEVMVPQSMAQALQLRIGDPLTVHFLLNPVRVRNYVVSGFYDMPMQNELGRPVVVVAQAGLAKLLGWSAGYCSHLEIELEDFRKMDLVRQTLEQDLPLELECRTLRDLMPALFDWLRFFDTNRWVLLVLLASVGTVNLVSALLILLLEKQKNLGILQSLGLRRQALVAVMTYLGLRLVVRGMVLANILVGILYLTQNKFHWFVLDPASYYLDFVPLRLDWTELALTNTGVLLGATLILLGSTRLMTGPQTARQLRFS